ncbi:sigma-70 family RNA polymerase sigma factor [Marinicella sp. S1101]|uniref:RNA polymerase sigma factor n=1 Tax=Marinicella marina TaxID=2996016 RepID=UPI002260F25F|nr:sigma-70 family RNA polymerase sigma factor [Marinicella marina]MCX7554275.1 sigma-70 family RNA polymerase sigma factor [Marinicella marina]MDJ1138734.1 sigma-70 family RNA polymerase sigma factor [Marinicella marina]
MNEQQLIIQAKQEIARDGTTNCFTRLVASYQARLYSYLLARCDNSFDADDVLQETFINAYKYFDSYDAQWQFSTWLFTIARRLLGKLKSVCHVAFDVIANQVVDKEQDPFAVDQNNIWQLIKQDIKPDAYDVLWFYYVEGLSIKEIAHVMHQSNAWVKTSLHRSRIKLGNNTSLAEMLEAS